MDSTLAYTPTKLEKLLGSWYKYYFFLSYNIVTAQAGVYATAIAQVSNFVNSFMIVYLWTINNANNQIITYLILGQLYRNITQTMWNERIGGEILTGKITNLLLVPHDYLNYHFYANLGQRIFRNLALVFTTVLIIFIYINSINFNWNRNLLFTIILIPLSFFVNFLLNVAVGMLAFFFKDRRDYVSTSSAIMNTLNIFTGFIIPLDILPYGLLGIFQLMPTAWLLHHPMQIYLGKYDANQTILVFLGGIVWCLVLYFLAKLVFKLGLKKNESVGL